MQLKVTHGAGDVIARLEYALEEAQAGRLIAVVICGVSPEGSGFDGAFVEDMPYPWPRLQAAVDDAQHYLLTHGVRDWK